MAKKRKKTAAKKRRGPRKMTAKQLKYFGPRKKRAGAKRAKRSTAKRTTKGRAAKRGSVRKTVRREEKGLRARVAKLEKHATAQKTLNRKQHTLNKIIVHGLDNVFARVGMSHPRGLHVGPIPKQLGG